MTIDGRVGTEHMLVVLVLLELLVLGVLIVLLLGVIVYIVTNNSILRIVASAPSRRVHLLLNNAGLLVLILILTVFVNKLRRIARRFEILVVDHIVIILRLV